MSEFEALTILIAFALAFVIAFVQFWFLGEYLGKKIATVYLVWDCKRRYPENPEIVKPYRDHLKNYKRG